MSSCAAEKPALHGRKQQVSPPRCAPVEMMPLREGLHAAFPVVERSEGPPWRSKQRTYNVVKPQRLAKPP